MEPASPFLPRLVRSPPRHELVRSAGRSPFLPSPPLYGLEPALRTNGARAPYELEPNGRPLSHPAGSITIRSPRVGVFARSTPVPIHCLAATASSDMFHLTLPVVEKIARPVFV